jgi:hypothetical protein
VVKLFKSLTTGTKICILLLIFNISVCVQMARYKAAVDQSAAEAMAYAKIAIATCGGGNVAGGYAPVSAPALPRSFRK